MELCGWRSFSRLNPKGRTPGFHISRPAINYRSILFISSFMCPFQKPNRVWGTKIILKIIPVINQIDVGITVHKFFCLMVMVKKLYIESCYICSTNLQLMPFSGNMVRFERLSSCDWNNPSYLQPVLKLLVKLNISSYSIECFFTIFLLLGDILLSCQGDIPYSRKCLHHLECTYLRCLHFHQK